MLDSLSGYEIGDPYWLADPEQPFLASAQPPAQPLKIAVCTRLETYW